MLINWNVLSNYGIPFKYWRFLGGNNSGDTTFGKRGIIARCKQAMQKQRTNIDNNTATDQQT